MNHIKTIGMLVLAVSAVMAAATFALPSVSTTAYAQQCAGAASSVSGTAAAAAAANNKECAAIGLAFPPQVKDDK